MPYVNTTFLPKTNLIKPFIDRLVARSDKGRVPGIGLATQPLAIDGGSNWVAGNVYEVGQTITAKTSTYTGGFTPVTYKCRFQYSLLTAPTTFLNGSWTNTTNAKNDVTLVIPDDGWAKVKFQTQATDAEGTKLNSFTQAQTIVYP